MIFCKFDKSISISPYEKTVGQRLIVAPALKELYGAHKGTLSVVIFFISFVRNNISFVRNIISFVRNIISFVRNIISFVRNDFVCTK